MERIRKAKQAEIIRGMNRDIAESKKKLEKDRKFLKNLNNSLIHK